MMDAKISGTLALLCFSISALNAEEIGNNKTEDQVLQQLEANMSAVKTVQASFVQEKELAVFKQKIVLEGALFLENPGRFAWHVHKPLKYAFVMSDKVVRQWDEDTNKTQRTSLSANPVFKVVAEQLRHWFSGQYAALSKEYDVSVIRREPFIELAFVPGAKSPARKAIRRIVVGFREDARYVAKIRIEDVSGDTTTLTFSKTVLNEPINPDAWEVKPRGQ